jgi:phenylacetate-CoA ligase
MSHETPIAVLIRRLAKKDSAVFKDIFGEIARLPTLTQFFPEMFYFEESAGCLLCSAFSGLPLVRYDLKDSGGVKSAKEILKIFSGSGIDLKKEAELVGIEKTIINLPFVYVYERSDFVVKLYGANIYPETIRLALQDMDLEAEMTGKFLMVVKNDDQQNQFLEINLELKPNATDNNLLNYSAGEIITKILMRENSEYRYLHGQLQERVIPRIICWPYESEPYFKPGGKQKWVQK